MKGNVFIVSWFAGLLLLGGVNRSLGQSRFDPRFYEMASRVTEHLSVSTDRSLYICGENIFFRADRFLAGVMEGSFWSSVLYAELVDAHGRPVVRSKYPLVEGVMSGNLTIPEGTLTGNYLLKCYTRWMRNQGPDSYSYSVLKIINPFQDGVVSGVVEDREKKGVFRGGIPPDTLNIRVTIDTINRPGKTLIALDAHEGIPRTISGCLSVTMQGAEPVLSGLPGSLHPDPDSAAGMAIEEIRFLPDRGTGLSLTGTVVNRQGEMTPLSPLRFSLLGERPDFFATVTDSKGRFAIQIPAREGSLELFVTPRSTPEEPLQVRIDQDFDNSPIPVHPDPFILPEEQRVLATRMALNVQLAGAFFGKEEQDPDTSLYQQPFIPFYGTPMFSLHMDEYVELPLLEEVFINLVPMVNVVRKRREARLEILSDNPAMAYYKPLLLVDHIPVYDHEDVMDLPPREISRIEVIHDVYVKGSLAFGGLISMISREGDMAGIDLPEGSYFFDLRGFSGNSDPEQVAESDPAVEKGNGSRIPDIRNTLLWIPDLVIPADPDNKNLSVTVSLKSPSRKGSYDALFRGVDSSGRYYVARSVFRVE